MIKYILPLLVAGFANAQVAIGKTEVSGNSSILEFAGNVTNTTNFRGIILPAVNSSPVFPVVSPSTNNPQNGTFIFDKQSRKVRMFENGNWVDLSDEGNSGSIIPVTGTETGSGAVIGAQNTNAQGVLILESTNKALILPHISNPHLTVKSPYPGMMCYDIVSNSLAVYDGSNWNFWK
ncbi:hypothetical protein [Chryseobacterium echinoideorum]|uniref:hypothetical protein n=1 Tax=Chryseobacterium echinoideorum TaxID=1549648 RepID=UPI001E3DFB01|nr:hypothetical protein [Chryseobacterium echinoideorum]